jgi:hypothetical protein
LGAGTPGPLVAVEQVREHLQGGAPLVVPVGGAADHLGVGAEGGVVDERAVGDDAQVHPQFLAVGEGIQAGGGVLPVQPQVQREGELAFPGAPRPRAARLGQLEMAVVIGCGQGQASARSRM